MSTQSQHILNFDAPAAARARDHAIERVESRANPAWAEEMILVGKQVARRLPEFTMDAITQEYARDPERPLTGNLRAMSGVVRKLQAMRIIQVTERFENSIRISKHGCPSRLYKSLIYKGGIGG